MACPICGERVAKDLGWLGRMHWVRCLACGMDYIAEERTPGGSVAGADNEEDAA